MEVAIRKPLTLETVQLELMHLRLHYPEAARSVEEMAMLCVDYLEDCSYMGESDFIEAVKSARKKCKFFPKIAEIIEIDSMINNRTTRWV